MYIGREGLGFRTMQSPRMYLFSCCFGDMLLGMCSSASYDFGPEIEEPYLLEKPSVAGAVFGAHAPGQWEEKPRGQEPPRTNLHSKTADFRTPPSLNTLNGTNQALYALYAFMPKPETSARLGEGGETERLKSCFSKNLSFVLRDAWSA